MAAVTRFKTTYPGVFYINSKAVGSNKPEKIYYIRYRRNGKAIEEKVGRQYQNDLTAARAARVRAQRIEGKEQSNQGKRKEEKVQRWTIERLWEQYRTTLSEGGAKNDTSRWRLYLEKTFAKKEPKDLVKLDTDRLRINLLKKLSPQTTKHALALLRRIINYGVNHGYIAPLPFKIEIPHVDNVVTEDLTPEQMQNLLAVLDTTHLTSAANMMKLVLCSGLRRGELFKLKWSDIDFNRGFIFIDTPKGGKSEKVPLNANAKELLESIPRKDSEYIWPSKTGGPRKDISKDARAIRDEAGLPNGYRPFHSLRHAFASMLASSGKVDLYTLQKLLTHKSPQMTQRYVHLRDETLKRASSVADDILNDAMKPIVKKDVA